MVSTNVMIDERFRRFLSLESINNIFFIEASFNQVLLALELRMVTQSNSFKCTKFQKSY